MSASIVCLSVSQSVCLSAFCDAHSFLKMDHAFETFPLSPVIGFREVNQNLPRGLFVQEAADQKMKVTMN